MYNTTQYFFARNITEFPQLVLIPLLCICIYYFMVGLSLSVGQFFLHFLIAIGLSFCGSSFALILGSLISDPKAIVRVAPMAMLPFTIFSGFFKNRQDLPSWIGWMEYISPNKYGLIAFLENQVAFRDSFIDLLNFDIEKWQAVIILFALGLFFRMISLVLMWRMK